MPLKTLSERYSDSNADHNSGRAAFSGLALHRTRPDSLRGIALVSVLWVMVLLSLMAVTLSVNSRSSGQQATNMVGEAEARHAVEGGIQLAMMNIMATKENYAWLPDGSPYEVWLGESRLTVAIFDENGKIGLNAATPEILEGLLVAAEVEEDKIAPLVDAILDWRDADDLRRLNGAEDEDYLAMGREEGAKDAPFENVDELKLVLGMEPEIYRTIRHAVTVQNKRLAITPQFAPRLVLLALPGADEQLIDDYIADRRRNHSDGLPLPAVPELEGRYLSATSPGLSYTVLTEAAIGPQIRSRWSVVIRREGRSAAASFVLISRSREEALLFNEEKP